MAEIHVAYQGPIVKRDDARANGINRFFTGIACRHGHVSQRNVTKGDCLSCVAISNKKQLNKPGEKQKRKEYIFEWRKNNKEYLVKLTETWMIKTHGSVSNYRAKSYIKNKDARKICVKQSTLRNPLRKKANDATRKARKRGAEGKFGRSDISAMLHLQNNKCVYCLVDLVDGFHVDHIMPLILGGTNWPNNLQCLCPSCNMRKRAKHPDDWHREIGYIP